MTSHGYSSANSWTPPAGMNEAYDVRSQTAISANGMTLCGGWAWQAAAGETGAKVATASASSDTGNTHILVLRRAP